jgi:sulfite exporter TauE/SafE
MELDVISAFLIGVAGAGHCVAMCGGISTMLTANLLKQQQNPLLIILGYNIGRILSYTVAGAVAGLTGSLAAQSIGIHISWLRLVAAVFVILLGLYIGQWSFALNKVESIGRYIWKYIQPFSKRFIPIRSPKQALCLGAIWGWLPCGLVYSTLTWSLASANPMNGALIMFAFGLGTLPALLTLASGYKVIITWLKSPEIRKITSILLIIYGIYSLVIALKLIF